MDCKLSQGQDKEELQQVLHGSQLSMGRAKAAGGTVVCMPSAAVGVTPILYPFTGMQNCHLHFRPPTLQASIVSQ